MKFQEIHPNIRLRLVMLFLISLANTMVFPFMAIYFSARFGERITGLLMSLEVVASVIAGLYGGYLADRLGRKKLMVFAELIRFIALSIICLVNSPWMESAILTFIMMTISTVFGGLSNPAAQAMIIDVSSPENRKSIYSINYWSMNGAFAIGGLLGGFLFASHRFELFLIVAAMSLLNLLILFFFITETYFPDKNQASSENKRNFLLEMVDNYKVVVKNTTFIIFTLATLLALSIEFQMRSYVGVRLADDMPIQTLFAFSNLNFNVDGIKLFGIMNAENSILVVSLGYLVNRFMKRFADKKVLYFGILMNGVAFCIIGFSNAAWIILITMVFASISELMYWPVTQAYLAEIPPEDGRSSYMAISGLVGRGAVMLGSLSLTLGSFLPPVIMGLLFLLTGIVSIALFSTVLKKLDRQKAAPSITEPTAAG